MNAIFVPSLLGMYPSHSTLLTLSLGTKSKQTKQKDVNTQTDYRWAAAAVTVVVVVMATEAVRCHDFDAVHVSRIFISNVGFFRSSGPIHRHTKKFKSFSCNPVLETYLPGNFDSFRTVFFFIRRLSSS